MVLPHHIWEKWYSVNTQWQVKMAYMRFLRHTHPHLLVLQVRGELIAVRERFAALALFFLLLAECQAGGLVAGPLRPSQARWT